MPQEILDKKEEDTPERRKKIPAIKHNFLQKWEILKFTTWTAILFAAGKFDDQKLPKVTRTEIWYEKQALEERGQLNKRAMLVIFFFNLKESFLDLFRRKKPDNRQQLLNPGTITDQEEW